MGLWSTVRAWLGLPRPPARAVVSVRRPVELTLDEADGDEEDVEITVADDVGTEMLRDLSTGKSSTAFSSPIVDEIGGQLRILARRSHNEADRAFFAALRRSVLNDGIDLRTMPKAIVPIQRMLGAAEVDIPKLASTLQLEPSIATRVVAIANCSLFGGQGRVGSVEDAIVRLGLSETRNIVMAITARSKLFRIPGHQREADALYAHALASAVAGKLTAERTGCAPGEEGFIACLLSELGRIAIFTAAGDLRRESRGKIDPSDKTVEHTSNELHGPVSALIAESWQFELATVAAIQYHHRPSSAPPDVRHLSQLMFVADDLAFRVIEPGRQRETSFGLLSARKALDVTENVDELVAQTKQDFDELIRLMDEPTKGRPPVRGKVV